MKRLLLSISLCAFCFCAFSQEILDTACHFRISESAATKYSLVIESEKLNVSCICMMLRDGHEVKGSVFNEFGIKAFDFLCDVENGRFTMIGSAGFLKRRALRKILGADFAFALAAKGACTAKCRRFYCENDLEYILVNDKTKIKYIFAEISNS